MKLDLLYEFQPKIGPYDKPFPYGQKEAEQATYDEAIEEIQLADTLGFQTVWVVEHHFRDGRSASPSNEVILGALSQVTQNIRLGFGVVLMPPGLPAPRAGGREGGHRRHPQPRARRVGHRPVHPHEQTGVPRARRRPVARACGGRRSSSCSRPGSTSGSTGRASTSTSRSGSSAPAVPGPAPAGVAGRGQRAVAPSPPASSAWACCRSRSCSRSTRWPTAVQVYRQGRAECEAPLPTVVATIASAPTRWCTAPTTSTRRPRTGLWDSVTWWYQNLAEFTLQWELAHLPQEEQGSRLPAAPARDRGRGRRREVHRPGHDHRGHPRDVPGEDPPLRARRASTSCSATCSSATCPTRRSCAASSCWAPR